MPRSRKKSPCKGKKVRSSKTGNRVTRRQIYKETKQSKKSRSRSASKKKSKSKGRSRSPPNRKNSSSRRSPRRPTYLMNFDGIAAPTSYYMRSQGVCPRGREVSILTGRCVNECGPRQYRSPETGRCRVLPPGMTRERMANVYPELNEYYGFGGAVADSGTGSGTGSGIATTFSTTSSAPLGGSGGTTTSSTSNESSSGSVIMSNVGNTIVNGVNDIVNAVTGSNSSTSSPSPPPPPPPPTQTLTNNPFVKLNEKALKDMYSRNTKTFGGGTGPAIISGLLPSENKEGYVAFFDNASKEELAEFIVERLPKIELTALCNQVESSDKKKCGTGKREEISPYVLQLMGLRSSSPTPTASEEPSSSSTTNTPVSTVTTETEGHQGFFAQTMAGIQNFTGFKKKEYKYGDNLFKHDPKMFLRSYATKTGKTNYNDSRKIFDVSLEEAEKADDSQFIAWFNKATPEQMGQFLSQRLNRGELSQICLSVAKSEEEQSQCSEKNKNDTILGQIRKSAGEKYITYPPSLSSGASMADMLNSSPQFQGLSAANSD